MHGIMKYGLKQRKRLGDAARRRTGKARSGWPEKVSSDLMNQMLIPHQNSVRIRPGPFKLSIFIQACLSYIASNIQSTPARLGHHVSRKRRYVRSTLGPKKKKTSHAIRASSSTSHRRKFSFSTFISAMKLISTMIQATIS